MPQSLSAVYVHAVFSTADRKPFLADASLRNEMHAFLGGISKQLDCAPLAIGGVEDHVHFLIRWGRTTNQAEWVKEVKRVSSRWAKERVSGFGWQSGYGAFSVSHSDLNAVRHYIATQEEHHRRVSFKDEFLALLREHHLEWDERYVWD